MLGLIVVVHEYGHYKVAVLCGVRVLKFSIGFGKPVFAWQMKPFKRVSLLTASASQVDPTTQPVETNHARQAGGGFSLVLNPNIAALPDPSKTIFLLSLVPLGGYVQMLDERVGEVTAELSEFAFNKKPLWVRAAVVAAGPLANLILAVLLYASVQWIGQMQPSSVLGHPVAGSVAEQVGLQSGDRILAIKVGEGDSKFQVTPTYKEFVNELLLAKDTFLREKSNEGAGLELPQWVELAVKRGEDTGSSRPTTYPKDVLGASPPAFSSPSSSPTDPVITHSSNESGATSNDNEKVDTTLSLDELLAMSPTQIIKMDLRDWKVSEHFQDSPVERMQALKALGLSGPRRPAVVNSVIEGGVANSAGVIAGDEVVKVNGHYVSDAQELVQLIHKSVKTIGSSNQTVHQTDHHDLQATDQRSNTNNDPVEPLVWVIKRNLAEQDSQIQINLTPRIVQEDGKPIGRVDAIIGGSEELVLRRLGFWAGWRFAADLTLDQALTSLRSFKNMLLGKLSWRELSGPITLAEFAGKSAKVGWLNFVSFVAFVSVSVGVLNLLPIPVLDGGQLMYYLWELLSGSAPSEIWSDRLMRFGLSAIIFMMCLALFNDALRLIG
jgi:membrane-associated protease RseP (regulator of RpoE activity)